MANLSNINDLFLVTNLGETLVNQTAAIGTMKLQVGGSAKITGNIYLPDKTTSEVGSILLGNSDGQLYHDGSNTYLADQGLGDLILRSNSTLILKSATTKVQAYGSSVDFVTIDSTGATFAGSVTSTKSQNTATSITVSNTNTGSLSQARFVAVSDSGNIQLKAVSAANTTYGAGDSGVINCDTMSGGLRFAHNDVVKMIIDSVGLTTFKSTYIAAGLYGGEVTIGGSSTAFGLQSKYDQGAATQSTLYHSPGYTHNDNLFLLGSGAGNTAQLVLKGDGNVGIGTATPVGQLSLNNQISNGANPVSSYPTTNPGLLNNQAFLNSYYASGSDGTGPYPRYFDIVCNGSPDGTNGGSNIRFFTNNITVGASSIERMRITSGGDVEIPTDSAKLKFRGSGSASYSSIFRDASNVIQIANTAGTNIVSIDNGGDVLIPATTQILQVGGASFAIELSYRNIGSNLTNDGSVYKTTSTHASYGYSATTYGWGNTYFYNSAAATTAGATITPTESMRITTSGDVLIGKTVLNNDDVGIWLNNDGASWFTQNNNYCLGLNRKGTDGTIVLFTNDQATAGTISVSGTSTAYNTSSDYRLKENVVPITRALDRVSQLKPSRFNFIADTDKIVDGFLAHEVQEVVPEAITGEKDEVDEEGNPVYQGIDQSKLVPLLVKAIQELKAEIDLLKNS